MKTPTILLIIVIIGGTFTIVNHINWNNTYQFGDFLTAFLSGLLTLTIILVSLYILRVHPLMLTGVVLVIIGAISNTTVMAINGGYMPVPITIAYRQYIPIEGAKLPWLADWILGGISPGDVALYLGLITIIVGTLIFLVKEVIKNEQT